MLIAITPNMYELLQRMLVSPVTKSYIMKTPMSSKTIKALMKHGLIDWKDNKYNEMELTPLGYKLLELEPRWTGNTKFENGNLNQIWNVIIEGDQVRNQERRKDLRLEHGKNTLFETRNLDQIQEDEAKKSAAFESRLLNKAS